MDSTKQQQRRYELAWLRKIGGTPAARMAARCGSAHGAGDSRTLERRKAALQRIRQS